MKKQYIAPKTFIVNINNQCALMAGSLTETLKTMDVMDESSFEQYGRETWFADNDDFDEDLFLVK